MKHRRYAISSAPGCHLLLSGYAPRPIIHSVTVRLSTGNGQTAREAQAYSHSGSGALEEYGEITVYAPSPSQNGHHSNALRCINLDWDGRTLGHDLRMGQPGVWDAKGLWDPQLRTKPITFLELWTATDNLRAFARDLRMDTHLCVWEDNQAVVHIINNMTTRSPALMKELRALYRVMLKLGSIGFLRLFRKGRSWRCAPYGKYSSLRTLH